MTGTNSTPGTPIRPRGLRLARDAPPIRPRELGLVMPEKNENARNPTKGTGALASYRWDEMRVGDSFVALPRHDDNALRSACWTAGCRLGWNFSVRREPDGRTAVWRTK